MLASPSVPDPQQSVLLTVGDELNAEALRDFLRIGFHLRNSAHVVISTEIIVDRTVRVDTRGESKEK